MERGTQVNHKWIAIALSERAGLTENDHETLMTAKSPLRNGGGLSISSGLENKNNKHARSAAAQDAAFPPGDCRFSFRCSAFLVCESGPICSHDSLMTEWHLSPFRPSGPSRNQ